MPIILPKPKVFPMFWYPPNGEPGLGSWLFGKIRGDITKEKRSSNGKDWTSYSLTVETLYTHPDHGPIPFDAQYGSPLLEVIADTYPMITERGRSPQSQLHGHYFGAMFFELDGKGKYPQPEFLIEPTIEAFLAEVNKEWLERYCEFMKLPAESRTPFTTADCFHNEIITSLDKYAEGQKKTLKELADGIPF